MLHRAGFPTLSALVIPEAALANWGDEAWGEMLWTQIVSVPALGWSALLIAALCVSTAGAWALRKRRPGLALPLLLVLVVLPLTVAAATINVPHIFSNGTVADANEINQNFGVLVTESNAQDIRLSSVESSVVHTHPGSDITSQVGDADTVDGVHASELEESAEIGVAIAAHAAIAQSHHVPYADPDAVAAMGAKQISNPLNHDRYTDAQALVAALGVDAGTLDGLDSTDFAAASHAHAGGSSKVAIVAQSGGDYTDPKAAMDDLATWCGTPSATNGCLVRIQPGIYDLGQNKLVMQSYVDIEGSGENTTTITRSVLSDANPMSDAATVMGASSSELRFLTVENQGGASAGVEVNFAIGIFNEEIQDFKMTNITVEASGGNETYGVANFGYWVMGGGNPVLTRTRMSNSRVLSQGDGVKNYGLRNYVAETLLDHVRVEARNGSSYNIGVYTWNGALARLRRCTVLAEGLGTSVNIAVESGDLGWTSLIGSTLLAGDLVNAPPGTFDYALRAASSVFPGMETLIQSSTLKGRTYSVSSGVSSPIPGYSLIRVSGSMLDGAVYGNAVGCIGAFDDSFTSLSSACL